MSLGECYIRVDIDFILAMFVWCKRKEYEALII